MSQSLLFIGIAGHAMRGLALAARDQGHGVVGLDEAAIPPGSDWLDEHHIKWSRTFDTGLLDGIDLVIISGGTAADHPALVLAEQRQIPIESFAEYLGRFTRDAHVISVGGTHGKTTTTSLITWLLEYAGRSPDFLIGIQPFNFAASARLEGAPVAVIEGDEYKASNLEDRAKLEYYHPDILVLTSVEHDHPDVYPDLASVVERFTTIVRAMPADGLLVAWAGSKTVTGVAAEAPCPVTTYGFADADYVARDIAYLPGGVEFDIETSRGIIGRMAAPIFGRHNVLNALAATVVGLHEGLSFNQILEGAAGFKGAYRRFNVLTPPTAAVTVIDDYAHHPTEVATTIQAVKLHFGKRRLVAVFRPHTYSRTKALLAEYRASFGEADVLYLTDIEGAREHGTPQTVSGEDIAHGLPGEVHYVTNRKALEHEVMEAARPGDVILCMTVSGYGKLANELAARTTSIKAE